MASELEEENTIDRFNEDFFDEKVAVSLTASRNKIYRKQLVKQFNEWTDFHEDHIYEMYELSGLDCDLDEFASYLFLNSLNSLHYI